MPLVMIPPQVHLLQSKGRRERIEWPRNLKETDTILRDVLRWERNELSGDDVHRLFQQLVSSGLAWKLSGAIRRTASLLLRDGRIHW